MGAFFTTIRMSPARVRTFSLMATGLMAVVSVSACSSRAGDAAASAKKAPAQAVETLTRRPISDTPQIKKVVDSAIEQTRQTFEYDPSYTKLEYPNGDVPLERGVCADVIVRAFGTPESICRKRFTKTWRGILQRIRRNGAPANPTQTSTIAAYPIL